MTETILLFLALFSCLYLGMIWDIRLLSDERKKSSLWITAGVSAAAAFILCLLKQADAFPALAGAAMCAVNAAVTTLLLRPDWKLLTFYTCSWLGIVFLADSMIYLVLGRYLALPQAVWMSAMTLWRIPVFYAVTASSHFIVKIKESAPYCRSVWGTPFIGLSGVVFLTCLSVSSADLKSLPIVWAVLAAALFLRVVLALSHIKYQREKELLSTIELKNALLEKNYTAVNQAYATNARLFHDFHRHLEILRQIAGKNRDTAILEYIETISGPLREITTTVWTGDETVDYIINSRFTRAKESGINMEMNIEYPYNTSIRSNDLCTILSNLLDNAIEAASSPRLGSGRTISLVIRRIQNILVIKLENSSMPPVYNSSHTLETTKGDHMLHGWGMKNIESSIEKYDGVIQTSYSEHIFRTTVTLSFDGVNID